MEGGGGKDKLSLEGALPPTSAASSPEVVPKPRSSDQKTEKFNNLLSRVQRPYQRELPEAPIVPEEGDAINGSKFAEPINDVNNNATVKEVIKILKDGYEKSKMKYDKDIEAVLSQYPDGVEMRVLTKYNDSIRAETMKLIEMEIRSKVRELIENHQKILRSHIDSYWPIVVEANLKNIKRKQEREEKEERERQELEAQKKLIEKNNELRLRKLQDEINKIILKSKMEYTENIEAVLILYPDGVEMKVLAKHNDSIRAEAMKLLEMEIRTKVGEDETVEIHQKVLQSHIDSYWPIVTNANNKNIERNNERENEKLRQQKKIEALKKLQQHIGASERRESATTSSTALSQSQHQQNKNKPLLQVPLVFHLQSSRIVMAMEINRHPTILENEFGEMQTPACVAFTSENKFVYGSEALIVGNNKSDSETDNIFWSVADLFLNSCFKTARVCINGTDHEITPEFFLAVLLSNLKETTEHKMLCQCTATVIAIPFSFSSLQRIQVKDAAKIAGFSEVYLVNEASAAAYNFVLSDMCSSSASEVLVLSENLDRVDAFVYAYNAFEKKLKMLGHAGNYKDETGRSQSWSFKQKDKSVYKFFKGYVSTDGDSSKKDDCATRSVRDACKSAINDASFGQTKNDPKESLYICENSSRWSLMLSNIAKDFGRKACDINQEDAVVSGAVILGRNPKEIGRFIRDKLAYDVERPTAYTGCRLISSRKEVLPENSKKLNVVLPSSLNSTSFHQTVLGVNHEIGKLSINMSLKCDQYIEPSLDITNEGIVKFRSATMESNSKNLKSRLTYNVPKEAITWLTPNLSEEILATLTSLLVLITVPKEDPAALVHAKICVLEKCREMEEKIAGDKFKLKSDLARLMVTKKITDAKKFATHANVSLDQLDDVNMQMDILQRLCDKYEQK